MALCFKEFSHRRENLPELFRSNHARMSDYLNEADG
ncbi:hypothetical protein GGP96_002065 [Salinibacter ruber]|nr:hypothetical protein [Salinibacter ruber]